MLGKTSWSAKKVSGCLRAKGFSKPKTVKILEKPLNDLIVCNRCTDLEKRSTEQQELYFEGNWQQKDSGNNKILVRSKKSRNSVLSKYILWDGFKYLKYRITNENI